MKLTRTWRALLLTSLAAATSLAGIVVAPQASAITPWLSGDVFVGAGNGSYKIYDNSGNPKETISDGLGGVTTGCAFNPSLSKLYTTDWSLNKVEVYDNASHNLVQTINTTSVHNESVVFTRNGDFYVSHPGGGIDHYSAAGTLLAVLASGVRVDWMDLASNQKTMFFTDEVSGTVHRWDVSTNTRLPDFGTVPPNNQGYGLRLLAPGDGSGGLLFAAGTNVYRLRADGSIAQSYNTPVPQGGWFALALDIDGTSFLASVAGGFYRFNLASGNVELGPINTGGIADGICVKGEPTAATSAALTVSKTGSPDPVTVGGVLTYQVTVSNAGPANATGVTMTDPLPAGVTFISASPSQGNCTPTAGTVTCSLGTIPNGSSATITIKVSPTAKGSLRNTARVTANEPNPNPGNATATTTTQALLVNSSASGEHVRAILVNSGPFPSVSRSSPGTSTDSATNVDVTGLLSAHILAVSTQISNNATASSSADVTDATLLAGAVTATTVHSSCTAGPGNASGMTTIAKLVVGGQTLVNITPTPNTHITIPGVAELVLNEQTQPQPGTITVNALHLHTLAGIDIVLAQSSCDVDP